MKTGYLTLSRGELRQIQEQGKAPKVFRRIRAISADEMSGVVGASNDYICRAESDKFTDIQGGCKIPIYNSQGRQIGESENILIETA